MGNVITPMWAECPGITRTILVGYVSLSLLLTLINVAVALPLKQLFLCSLRNTLGDMHLWTLSLSPFFSHFGGGMSFLMMLFEIYMGMIYFPPKERELGSLTFFLWLLLASCAQNAIFLACMAVLCVGETGKYADAGSQGLWPLLMVAMSMQHLLNDPSGSTSFWGVLLIPNKWYPAAIVGFFCLLNQSVMWNFAAGIAVGYIAFWRSSLHVDRLLPSVACVANAEQRLCANRSSLWGGSWLPAGTRGGYLPASRGATESRDSSGPAPSSLGMSSWISSGSGKSSKNFVMFSGQGNRLGDAEDDVGTVEDGRGEAEAIAGNVR